MIVTGRPGTSLKPFLKGISTYIPRPYKRRSIRGRGNSDPRYYARYCYSIWMRHLVMASQRRLPTDFTAVAELGPGASLGTGMAALLSGAHRYAALEAIERTNQGRDLRVFDEMVELFHRRERIPDGTEFPNANPGLDSYDFPGHILTNERLQWALEPSRLASIRNSLSSVYSGPGDGGHCIRFFVPWNDQSVIQPHSIDLIYSQAVLEHVNDLEHTYEALHCWLKPGGVMSHQIDYKSHGTAREWNGHWAYSDLAWKIVKGRREVLLNREPHSTHRELIHRCGFETVCDRRVIDTTGIQRSRLAARFESLSDEDLTTSGAFIQAIKQ